MNNIVKKTFPLPMLFIVMGVSGTGKSTLAKEIADDFSISYLDADDFHSEQAKKHMAANKPLTDAMRKPWLVKILTHLHLLYQQDQSVVLAYSGLKAEHRTLFRGLPFGCYFFCLSGNKKLIASRMSQRAGHFFSPELLDSQFEAMEFPKANEADVSVVNIDRSFIAISTEINKRIDEIREKIKHV